MDTSAISDNGLIHAICLDGAGAGRSLSGNEVHAWTPQQGVLWLHLDYSDAQVQQWLGEQDDLPKIVVDALLMPETRPRAVSVRGALLLTLRGIDHSTNADAGDMIAVRMFSDGERLITTSRRRLLALDYIAAALQSGQGPENAAAMVAELASELASGMQDTIDRLEDLMDDHEDRMLSGEIHELRNTLAGVRRTSISLHRYLLPQRDALAHFALIKLTWMGEVSYLQIREVGDWVARYIEDLTAVRDRAVVVHEELLSRASEQVNRRMYVLSVVAAIFLPLSFLTGLLGVNLGGLPGGGSADVHAFWIFCALLLAVVGVQAVLFRWMKWF